MDSDEQVGNTSESKEAQAKDGQSRSGHQVVRSYECTFCKRGFSNAQALGGHMNIHRKDKAKIKQLSTSITSSNQKGALTSSNVTAEQDQDPSSTLDHDQINVSHQVHLEVDLELRLGPEPQDSSPAEKGTRKFF